MKLKSKKEYRFRDNPEECAFFEAWAKFNLHVDHLSYLLDDHQTMPGHPIPCSNRDHDVAVAVVQWLGSPVGQCFLRDLGYVKAKP